VTRDLAQMSTIFFHSVAAKARLTWRKRGRWPSPSRLVSGKAGGPGKSASRGCQ